MGTSPLLKEEINVVVFDTSCLLCSWFVKTLLQNDNGKLHYTGFESQFSKQNLPESLLGIPETVLFLDKKQILVRSEAVFRIIGQLQYPIKLLMIFSIVPTSLSDYIYKWVAKNRYSWFGSSKDCFIPTEEQKSQFLD